MKKDLSEATFIIPVRIESEDRMRNVLTSIVFLLENFDTNIIIKEVDTTSVFEEDILPQLKEFYDDLSSLEHVFEKSEDPVFYRMHILNEMLAMTSTKVVVNCDCDILLPVESYLESYRMIMDGEADVVYPYGNGNYQKQVFANDELVSEFLSNECDFSILENKSSISTSDFGWIQFFNRKVYIEGGMENENFRGSSPEDKERFYRFTTLGYNVKRLDNFIYHLEHSRGRNSWPTSIQGNPYMQQNFELWNALQSMNKEQLLDYYSNQEYLKKYDNCVLSS
jgi:predicted glycosyltransferase involved in capsule biosynthesis